jgi:hypothetical protein
MIRVDIRNPALPYVYVVVVVAPMSKTSANPYSGSSRGCSLGAVAKDFDPTEKGSSLPVVAVRVARSRAASAA